MEMKKILLILCAVMVTLTVSAKDNASEPAGQYQIQGAGPANGGSSMVYVTVMAKKADKVTEDMLVKAAVHGVLFRDYTDASASGFGASSHHPAMMGSPAAYAQHLDFFEPFFRDGQYRGYAQYVDDSRRVVKSGKEYKVSAKVAVSSASLRKDLEKQGLLNGLRSGW